MNQYQKDLIKLASKDPRVAADVIPALRDMVTPPSVRLASQVKEAFNEKSEQFVAWCVMRDDKWTVAECQRVLDKIGVPFVETLAAPKRGPLEKGERVKVNAVVNVNPKNTDVCTAHDGQTGFVDDVGSDFLVIEFEAPWGGKARFEGVTSGKETGLGRQKALSEESTKRAGIEVVYISKTDAPPPSKLSLKRVQDYLDKGFAAGESRFDIYHMGMATVQTTNKEGQYYFKFTSTARDNDYRSMNPVTGKVLYIGLLGHRPGGWESDFAKMVAEAASAGDDD